MWRSIVTLPLRSEMILVILCSILNLTVGIDVKECFDGSASDPPGNVTLTCAEGYVISIEDAFFGKNKWMRCILIDGDCIDRTNIFQICEGMNNCTRTFKTYSPQCGYSTVLRLTYHCTLSYASLVKTSSASTTSTVGATTLAMTTLGVQNLMEKNHGRTTETLRLENDEGSNLKEIGLIVACVVASVVTVIALVIAIIMVVRRLCQSSDKEDTEDNAGSAPSTSCLTCVSLDHSSCFGSNKSGSKGKEVARKQPAAPFRSSHRMSKNARMAPVGQESSSSESVELDGMSVTTNANDVVPTHAGENQNQNASHQKTDVSRSFQAGHGKNKHSKHKNKQQSPAGNIVNQPEDNFSNNNEEKLVHHKKNTPKDSLVTTSQSDSTDREHNNLSTGETAPQSNNFQRRRNDRPKFDAVAIPNTEIGTHC